MNIEKELINLLLRKDFYEENKGRVNKEMFTNVTVNLYETITRAHNDSEKDLTLDQIASLHLEVYNPASTRAAKENFNNLIEEIKDKEIPDKKIANNILKSMHKRNMAQRIAVGQVHIKKTQYDLHREIMTFGPRMAHDDTIDALAYACKYAHPPQGLSENKGGWYKKKREAKNWVTA